MKTNNKKFSKEFFNKSPDIVAKKLLGKVLCRKLPNGEVLRARIVETEAYFDEKDPASRASKSSENKINKVHEMMLGNPGDILLYNVHKYIMLNFVTQEKGNASAVLIRSLEPLNFSGRCSGPGLLTGCLKINKLDKEKLNEKILWVENSLEKTNKEKIGRSFRIGVSLDLKEKHRYFIKGNKFLSRKEK